MVVLLSLALAAIDVKMNEPANSVEPLAILETSGFGVNCLTFSPDGTVIAIGVACDDCVVELWNLRTHQRLSTLRGHAGHVYSVAYSGDGKLIASGDGCGAIRLWQVATSKAKATFLQKENDTPSLAFSPDGSLLASGGDKGVVLWDVAMAKIRAQLKGPPVTSVAFSGDGKLIASGGEDGTIILWNAATGTEKETLLGSVDTPVSSVAFSPDGNLVAASNRFDSWDVGGPPPIQVWSVATGEVIVSLKGHSCSVTSVSFSPDGKLLASVSGAGVGDDEFEESPAPYFELKLWDVTTGQELASLSGETGQMLSVAFSPDGKVLATGDWADFASGDGTGTVRLWDVQALLKAKK